MIPVSEMCWSVTHRYDVVIVAVGFEYRSSHLVRRGLSGNTRVAFAFQDNQVCHYVENEGLSLEAGYSVVSVPEGKFRGELRRVLNEAAQQGKNGSELSVAFDISSMTRQRLAAVVLECRLLSELGYAVQVDFYYSPATYRDPPEKGGVLKAAPVLDEFKGSLRPVSLPIGLVLGLGFEPQRALGVHEYLEPSRAWAFAPIGGEPEFEMAGLKANRELYGLLGRNARIEYPISKPASTFYALESFVSSISDGHRVVLVPLGPKVFALCCLLISVGRDTCRPAVWRVGEVPWASSEDIHESGVIAGLSARFVTEASHY